MDIVLRSGATVLKIPVPPAELFLQVGDQVVETVNIVNLGPVDFPVGKALDGLEWSSFFPVRYDPGYCTTRDLVDPRAAVEILEEWKDNRLPVRVTVPILNIGLTVQVRRFTWGVKPGEDLDIYYTLGLVEHREIMIRQVTVTAAAAGEALTMVQDPKVRPPSTTPAPAKPSTYTVKSGDSLSLIAKKHGTTWSALYDKNKAVVGVNPNLIYPGQVLTL